MINVLDIDGATRLDLKGVYAGHRWQEISFEHFLDEDEEIPEVLEGPFRLIVSKDQNETDIRLNEQLILESNTKIIIRDLDQTANILKAGQYYYRIEGPDNPCPEYYGILTVNHIKAKYES